MPLTKGSPQVEEFAERSIEPRARGCSTQHGGWAIAIDAMRSQENGFDLIIACVFDEETLKLYEQALKATDEPELRNVQGREVRLQIVQPLKPSSFEIAMMAKLQTMLPEEVFERLKRSRQNASLMVSFSNPEVQKIWEAICDDRQRLIREAFESGTYPRHRSNPES